MILVNAIAYDWLYNDLTEQERTTVRNSLIKHAGESYEAATYPSNKWSNWWQKSYLQNHWSTNIAGLGVAALALEPEYPQASVWLDYAIAEFQKDKRILEGIDDGTWHEGYNYENGKFVPTLPFYINLERIKGTNLFAEEYFRNFIIWKAYNYLPGSEAPAFPIQSLVPDWGWNAGLHQVPLRYFAGRYNNGYAEWLAQSIVNESGRIRYTGNHAPNMVYEFLYYNASVIPRSPDDLPTDTYFPDAGIVAWRTGWGPNDLVFGFKCDYYGGIFGSDAYLNRRYPFDIAGSGANAGHDHADSNSFLLYKGGTDLSSEKPHRQTYDEYSGQSTTLFHNTVIVDGKNQYACRSQGCVYNETGGRILSVVTMPDFNYLAGDATDMYRDMVGGSYAPGARYIDEFTRRVVFVKPGYFVVVDNLRSGSTHQYEYVAQVGPGGATNTNNIAVEGDWIKGTVGTEILGIKVLSPQQFAYTKAMSTFSGQGYSKAHIRIRPQSNVQDNRFITVLFPSTASSWNSKPQITLLGESDSGAGVRVGSGTDTIIRYDAGPVSVGDYVLNGDAAVVRSDSSGFMVVNSTSLLVAGESMFQASENKTLEAKFSGSRLELFGTGLDNIGIRAPGVSEVRINGIVTAFTAQGDYVTIGTITVNTCGAADTDNDNMISPGEVMAQINPWRSGTGGIKDLMQNIRRWKEGC